jgi:hypothetical protein
MAIQESVMAKYWRAMASAPKDGRPIIALYDDCSGVVVIRWGAAIEDNEEQWFEADYSDASFQEWAGWIPFPEINELLLEAHPDDLRGRKMQENRK